MLVPNRFVIHKVISLFIGRDLRIKEDGVHRISAIYIIFIESNKFSLRRIGTNLTE